MVIEIGKHLFSDKIFEKKFLCDLESCKGACCVEGDAGAPLTSEEAKIVENYYDDIQDLLSPRAIQEIEKQGYHVNDEDFEIVTPVIDDGLCVYTYYDNGVVKCAFEKRFYEGKIDFKKPVSCHLFPIRVQTTDSGYDISNYEYRSTCDSGCTLGEKEDLPLYRFLKEAIERYFGEDVYQALDAAYTEYYATD